MFVLLGQTLLLADMLPCHVLYALHRISIKKKKKLIDNYSQGPCITIPLQCVSGWWAGVRGTRQTWTDVRYMYYCLATQLSAASYY